jgi:23S rRNA (guanosine2251-2'-O)-methyltransferase
MPEAVRAVMKDSILIGGFHAVLAVLEDGADKPYEIWLASGREDERSRQIQQLAKSLQIPLYSARRQDLDLKAPGLRHQGVVAYMPAAHFRGEDALEVPATPQRLLLALEHVQDPHNLGACLRTAEAVGVDAVIIPKDRSAGLTAVARKAAAGAAERVPVIAVTNLVRSLERLKELGYWVTGLAGEGAEDLYGTDLTGPTVIVMGAEGEGLRRLTRETCDRLVRIPMLGKAESLNVSVATAVCLYEAFRQRRIPPPKRK